MKSFAPILLASAGLIGLSAAQVYPPTNPDDIDINIRDLWCVNQQQACPALCEDQEQVGATVNDCDPETLSFECLCENNTTPNMTEYSLTIPYQLCKQSITDCVANCGNGEAVCSNLCFTGKKCGASDPTLHNSTTTTSAPTPSKTSNKDNGGDSDKDDDGNSFDDEGDEDDEGLAATMATSGTALGLGLMAAVAGMGFLGLI
jgi:hypothetical protein